MSGKKESARKGEKKRTPVSRWWGDKEKKQMTGDPISQLRGTKGALTNYLKKSGGGGPLRGGVTTSRERPLLTPRRGNLCRKKKARVATKKKHRVGWEKGAKRSSELKLTGNRPKDEKKEAKPMGGKTLLKKFRTNASPDLQGECKNQSPGTPRCGGGGAKKPVKKNRQKILRKQEATVDFEENAKKAPDTKEKEGKS